MRDVLDPAEYGMSTAVRLPYEIAVEGIGRVVRPFVNPKAGAT